MRFSTLALSPIAALAASCAAPVAHAGGANLIVTSPSPQVTQVTVTDIATFDEPWAMTFLPGTNDALITEKKGVLKIWQNGKTVREVAGAPKVAYGGQGGFGDVVVAPDFAKSRTIYLSWVEAGQGGTYGAVVGKARLEMRSAGPRLQGLRVVWRQVKVTGQGHYSHRIAFSPDGQYMYVTSGERQKFYPAQNLTNNLGKVLRLLPDGKPAPGNPFATGAGAGPQIWTYGHRNLLGLAFDTQGRLWDLEHGPAGGDELNLIKPGLNYGWPRVSNGDNYDGTPIPRHATRPEFEAPAISWNPVIAPGDLIFYSGTLFKGWQGNAIATGLVSQGLVRIAINGEIATEAERIPLGHRIREVEQGPDGALYILEDGPGGRLRKIVPAN